MSLDSELQDLVDEGVPATARETAHLPALILSLVKKGVLTFDELAEMKLELESHIVRDATPKVEQMLEQAEEKGDGEEIQEKFIAIVTKSLEAAINEVGRDLEK